MISSCYSSIDKVVAQLEEAADLMMSVVKELRYRMVGDNGKSNFRD
ncbi:MAG: hypothetical protein FWC33_00350 [Candidatus Bathyarchaeota archaeon]|nr:hypothetical protein [Candidatus Termiticorpusculum sp.]